MRPSVTSWCGYLAAHGVEGREDDGFGCVVHHDFNAGGSFQGANVASFAADDAAFDFVRFDVEHGNRVFDGRFRGYALDGLDDDAFGFLVGRQLGFVHDVVDVRLCLRLGFFLERFYQAFLRLVGREARDGFQFFDFLALQVVQLVFLLVDDAQLCFQVFADGVGFLLLALQFFLSLVQHQFALFQFVFGLLDFLVTGGHFLFQVGFLVEELFLYFEQLVFLDHFRFGFRVLQDAVVFRLQAVLEEHVRGGGSDEEAGEGHYYRNYCHFDNLF